MNLVVLRQTNLDISRRYPVIGAMGQRMFEQEALVIPYTHTPLPTWTNMPNLIAAGQTVRANVWRSACKKNWASRVSPFKSL